MQSLISPLFSQDSIAESCAWHPEVVTLGLADKKIVQLSSSLSRTTLVTDDNHVAVLVDHSIETLTDYIQVGRHLKIVNVQKIETCNFNCYSLINLKLIYIHIKLYI